MRPATDGPRRGTPADFLVVGLGNPGAEYAGTRHNIGADAVERLVDRHLGSLSVEKGLRARVATVTIGGLRILCSVPLTYMNESGLAVASLVRRSGILDDTEGVDPGVPELGGPDLGGPDLGRPAGGQARRGGLHRLVVLHDELDLPSGRVKIKVGGGTAGNNGLKSIHAHLHSPDYLRVRIGIGKPPGRQPGADYVLKRPGAAERETLSVAAEVAADAVEHIAIDGVHHAMNQINPGA